MIEERLTVSVDVERRPAASRWQAHVWRPVALAAPRPTLAPWTALASDGATTRFHAGDTTIVLRSAETKVLRDNATSPTPSAYVVLRRGRSPSGWSLYLVTLDPSEAHAHADVGEDLVEALPMPSGVHAWVSRFVARHHVERPEWKRRRDRPNPDALGARRNGASR